MRIFISYSTKDYDFVSRVASYLRARGHDVWIDQLLLAGDNWWDCIVRNIRDCDILLTFLTQRALKSIYCSAERKYAKDLGKHFLPYLLEKIDLPPEEKLDVTQATFLPGYDDASQFTVIEFGIEQHSSKPRTPIPDPEPQPPTMPKFDPNDIVQLQIAMEDGVAALDAQNFSLANLFLTRVAQTSYPEYARLAIRQLTHIRCRIQYDEILALVNTPSTNNEAVSTRIVQYKEQRCEYDPQDILSNPEFITFRGTTEQWNFVKILIDERSALPQRLNAAKALGKLGDPRPGIGVKHDLPDIVWRELEGYRTGEGETVHLSKFPVTNAQFAIFHESYSADPLWWGNDPVIRGTYNPAIIATQFNYPVTHVTWYEARAFCRWLSAKSDRTIDLPTEREWLYGARGNNSHRKYPYDANVVVTNLANLRPSLKSLTSDLPIDELCPVGTFPQAGNSVYQLVDMLGNIWEWCRPTTATERHRIPCRGGGWHDLSESTDLSVSIHKNANTFRGDLGFRITLYQEN